MAQSTLSIRMDEEVIKQFDMFCAEVGMNTSVAVNLFAKAVIREKRIPFAITADPFYNSSNLRMIDEGIADFKAGNVVTKSMAELEAMANE
jgi:DNA-damage-inducible protein J